MQQTLTFNQLFAQIKQLSPQEQLQLAQQILTNLFQQLQPFSAQPKVKKERIPNLHPGAMVMLEGFDDELPDEFWLGGDEDDELFT